jgi:hypothetical protein
MPIKQTGWTFISFVPCIVTILITSYLLVIYCIFLGDGDLSNMSTISVGKISSVLHAGIDSSRFGFDTKPDPDEFPSVDLNIPKKIKWDDGDIEIELPGLKHYDKESYPEFRPLLDRIKEWNPDNPDPPEIFSETLQHFDYSNPHERLMAEKYRDNEVPFKIYNVPQFDNSIKKWSDDYLSNVLQSDRNVQVEMSNTNHFMYWALKSWKAKSSKNDKWKAPTTVLRNITFDYWLDIAKKADNKKFNKKENMESTHYYFMTSAPRGDRRTTFVARDLPLFSSGNKNFFIPKPEMNKGTQCRFGMRGIISEAHFDCGRNMVLMMRGAKRYILTPPQSCDHIKLLPDPNHPSYRHSTIDWSNVTQASNNNFDKVNSIDTIVKKGEILFIPSYWVHYIISTKYSIQCNSRFGPNENDEAFKPIKKCFERDLGSAIEVPDYLHGKVKNGNVNVNPMLFGPNIVGKQS